MPRLCPPHNARSTVRHSAINCARIPTTPLADCPLSRPANQRLGLKKERNEIREKKNKMKRKEKRFPRTAVSKTFLAGHTLA
eukprot:220354-Prorocentrum_minimum.AAC.1